MPDPAPYLTVTDFKARLANAGGAGARTAAELPEERLAANSREAEAVVIGRLRHFTLPAADAENVPDLLLTIIAGFAGYTATLEFFGSQPFEDRDPVVLRYLYAKEQLAAIQAGDLVVPGIDPGTGGNPDQQGGDPETYQPPSAYLGLAEGLTDYPGGGYAGGGIYGRGWSHGGGW